MNTLEEQGLREKEAAEQIIAQSAMLPGIESVRVELGDDHSGDPSMWLVFKLDPALQFNDEFVRDFNDFSNEMSLKLLHSGLTRFPYTRLESAR